MPAHAISQHSNTISRYRWVMLITLMLLAAITQLQWLTHAAVARPAAHFYAAQINGSSWLDIDYLALIFMLVYLVISLPASWFIARFGLAAGLRLGAVLLGIFSLIKGAWGENLAVVFMAQVGLAIAQPLILNAITTLTDQWFPISERAMAAGMAVLAQFIGILVLVMVVTPMLVVSSPSDNHYGQGMTSALMLYGFASTIIALLSLLLIRDPLKQHGQRPDTKAVFTQMTTLLNNKNMRIGLFLFMVGVGIFNAVSSLTDAISAQLQVQDSDGLLATAMLVGGMIGAVIIPILSDRYQIRKPLLIVCLAGMLPGMAGIAFAGHIFAEETTVFTTALISAFVLGFFVLGAGPVGFQYVAEVTTPVPEAYSQGLLLLAGQISGIVLVAIMTMENHAWLNITLQSSIALIIACLAAVTALNESPVIHNQKMI